MGVCGRWVEEIARAHAYGHLGKIAFANCDIQRWPLEYWEFAKAFMCDMGGGRCKDDKWVGDTSKGAAVGVSKGGNGRPEVKEYQPERSVVQPTGVLSGTKTEENKRNTQANSSGGSGVSIKDKKPIEQSNSAEIQTQDNENDQPSGKNHKPGQVDKSSSNNETSSKSKSNRILVGGKVMIVGKRRPNMKSNKLTNKPELSDKPIQLSKTEPKIESKESSVSRPLSTFKTTRPPSPLPSKGNPHTTNVQNKPKPDSQQQPEKIHSNQMKTDTPKTIHNPPPSKHSSHEANPTTKSISNTTQTKSNTSTTKPVQIHHQDKNDANPDEEYAEEHIDLIHLLCFLVNCTALHTSARKSRDLEGGLSARHVIRIKKVIRHMLFRYNVLKFFFLNKL